MNAVRLIAARELREGSRTKAYRIGTVLMVLLIAAAIALPQLIGSGATTTTVGVVGGLDPVTRSISQQVAASTSLEMSFVDLGHRGDAQEALRSGAVDVALIDGKELLVERAVRAGDLSPRARLVSGLSVLLAIKDTGPVPVNGLDPPRRETGNARDRFTGFGGVLIIFIFIMNYGIWVLGSVTEEKTNKLAELLLASVRPVELMIGKVTGVGVLALVQATIVGAAALLAVYCSGSESVQQITGRMVAVVLLWFVLAYAFYGLAYAAAGATVARPEDARSAPGPLMIPLIVGYVAPITAMASGQDSTFLRVLSMIPFTAPFGMAMRVGLGTASLREFALAVGLMLLAIAVMGWVSARIYRNSILRTGKKTGLVQAFRLGG